MNINGYYDGKLHGSLNWQMPTNIQEDFWKPNKTQTEIGSLPAEELAKFKAGTEPDIKVTTTMTSLCGVMCLSIT